MSLDLTLALALFLGAMWVTLLNNIVTITRERPAEHTLIAVAFVHLVVLIYFVLAAAVLYGKTLKTVLRHEWSGITTCEEILVITWPAAALAGLFGFLAVKLTGWVNPLLTAVPFLALGIWLLIWARRAKYLLFVGLIVVLFIPYVLVMSWFWCGVNVTTDQQYYRPGDIAVITAKAEGYLFNPGVKSIEIWAGRYPKYEVPGNVETHYARMTQPITPDMVPDTTAISPTYIRTTYTPQAWWFSRDEYTEIQIVPDKPKSP
ncbi:MAG TPA: hypothetical protein VGJ37_14500 [Pyrinomonadaceae bacterium]|jgi:hypothetical protein